MASGHASQQCKAIAFGYFVTIPVAFGPVLHQILQHPNVQDAARGFDLLKSVYFGPDCVATNTQTDVPVDGLESLAVFIDHSPGQPVGERLSGERAWLPQLKKLLRWDRQAQLNESLVR